MPTRKPKANPNMPSPTAAQTTAAQAQMVAYGSSWYHFYGFTTGPSRLKCCFQGPNAFTPLDVWVDTAGNITPV